MANRSYLYSFNKDKNGNVSKIFDISEQNYEIPIIHQILVSVETEIVSSHIFDGTDAIIGNAKKGRQRLEAFFIKLLEKNIFDKKELKSLQSMFIEHLDKYTLDYFLFEPAEVISMNDVEINEEIAEIKNNITDYDTLVEHFLKDTCDDCWSELGIDFSTILFVSLGQENEVAEIEMRQASKAAISIRKKLEEKPTTELYLQLIGKLDNDESTNRRDDILDKAVVLTPSYEELIQCASLYLDVDKKIALYNDLLLKKPNDTTLYYSLSRVHKDKKDWAIALSYAVKYIECSTNPLEDTHFLVDIIDSGKFDKQEIFETLSKKVKIKRIEVGLVECYIEKREYQKALNYFYEVYDFIKDKEEEYWRDQQSHHIFITWKFFYANQIEMALELAMFSKCPGVPMNYFNGKHEFEKALYWGVMDMELDNEYISNLLIEYETYNDGEHDDGEYYEEFKKQ